MNTSALCAFASLQENGAKHSEDRGREPCPSYARPLEFKQHAESSGRQFSRGETQACSRGGVVHSLLAEGLLYCTDRGRVPL